MDQIGLLYHKRMEDISTEIFPHEYKVMNGEYNRLYHEIANLLPKDKINLIRELENVHGTLVGIQEEMSYRLGFCDALKISAEVIAKTA